MLLLIAEHATAADRHDLVAQLLSPSKPPGVSVTEFHYRLLELNGFVDWLPGTDAKLNDHQIKQALYDGMPTAWKERFITAGKSPGQRTLPDVADILTKPLNGILHRELIEPILCGDGVPTLFKD
jgi:hypothetical protein